MKRKTIASLTEELNQEREARMSLESLVNEISHEIGEIMKYEKNYGSYSRYPLKQIPNLIYELKGKIDGLTQKEGEMRPIYEMNLRNENNKLWYLVRAFGGDTTLKGYEKGEVENYKDFASMQDTPFNRPNFSI